MCSPLLDALNILARMLLGIAVMQLALAAFMVYGYWLWRTGPRGRRGTPE